MKLSSLKIVAAVGGLALSLTTGVGVASAQPDTSILVNTTCSYGQIQAALNAERPDLAPQFNDSPVAKSLLTQFLAAPRAQRQQMVNNGLSNPMMAAQIDPIMQVAGSCNNY